MQRIRILAAGGFLIVAATSADAQTLRGSTRTMEYQNRVALDHDFSFLETRAQVLRFVDAGYLVRVAESASVELHNVSYPYARPAAALFVERLGEQYRAACGERLVVTSLTRPLTMQERLRNSSDLSVHPAGMAIDLRIPRTSRCRGWLESVLLQLEGRGVLDAIRERNPAHFHVAVFPAPYADYVARLTDGAVNVIATGKVQAASSPATATASTASAAPEALDYRVSRGDTLWDIARKFGVTVSELREANNLRGSRIAAGQTLTIPVSSSNISG